MKRLLGVLLGLVLIAVPVIALACPPQLQLNVTAVGSCVEGSPAYSVTATATPSSDGWTLQGITGAPANTQSYSVTATWTKVNVAEHINWGNWSVGRAHGSQPVEEYHGWILWYHRHGTIIPATYYTETRNVSGTIPTQACDFDVTICYQGITQTVKNSALGEYQGYTLGTCEPTTETGVDCKGVFSITTTETVPGPVVYIYEWVDPYTTETFEKFVEPTECLKTHCEVQGTMWYQCESGAWLYGTGALRNCPWCGGLNGTRVVKESYDCGETFYWYLNGVPVSAPPQPLGRYSCNTTACFGK